MAATAAYRIWVAGGRRYVVAHPIVQFVEYAKAAGIGWLGTLGSDDERHLQASKPQDHTPFSTTAWPLPLLGYVVTACDLTRGAWCDTFLAECRAGRHPWVKYINFGGHHYDVRNGWRPEVSGDEHFHVSCRSDYVLFGLSKDPFRSEDMELSDINKQPLFVSVPGIDKDDVPPAWDPNDPNSKGYTVGQQLAFAQQDARYARAIAEQNRETLAIILKKIETIEVVSTAVSKEAVQQAVEGTTWKMNAV